MSSSRRFNPESGTGCPFCLFGAIALLTILFWAGYWHVTAGDWRGDDPDHMTTAQNLGFDGLYRLFVDHELWKLVSMQNFTPVNVAIYGLWDRLFGPQPKGAYAHHLLNLFLLALAYFTWLLRYVRLPVALVVTLLCFASLPMYELAHELMSDHYVLGALFAVLALNAFDEAPQGGWRFWLTGALLGALAALCKEIFGFVALYPLIRELLAAPPVWRNPAVLHDRLGPAVFALLPMAGFALWRRIMLGNQAGGYGFYRHGQPGAALGYVFGDHIGLVLAATVIILATLGLARGWRLLLAALLLAIYVYLPSLFIPAMLARHWLLPLLVIGFYMALAWPTDFKQPGRAMLAGGAILLLAVLLLGHSRTAIPQMLTSIRQKSEELRATVVRINRGPLSAEITDIDSAKRLVRARKICAMESSKGAEQICRGQLTLAGRPIDSLRNMAELEALCPLLTRQNLECRGRVPFTITADYHKDVLKWRSKPCPEGHNSVLYKPDSHRNQLYNGLDLRLDWLVSHIPCAGEPTISVSGLSWLEMMVIMGDGQGGKFVTPIFRADLTQGSYQHSLEALHLVPVH